MTTDCVLQCVAVCCSALQCVAVCCSVLRSVSSHTTLHVTTECMTSDCCPLAKDLFAKQKQSFSKKSLQQRKLRLLSEERERQRETERELVWGGETERGRTRERGGRRERKKARSSVKHKRCALIVTPASLRYLLSVFKNHKLYSIISCQIKALLCYQK